MYVQLLTYHCLSCIFDSGNKPTSSEDLTTHTDFLALTKEQKYRLHEVFNREGTVERVQGMNFIDWLEKFTSAPSMLADYVGVNWCGMYLGIETDGHCHS